MSTIDAARITKPGIEMIKDESWGQRVKGQGHESQNIAGVGLCTLVSAGFFSLLLLRFRASVILELSWLLFITMSRSSFVTLRCAARIRLIQVQAISSRALDITQCDETERAQTVSFQVTSQSPFSLAMNSACREVDASPDWLETCRLGISETRGVRTHKKSKSRSAINLESQQQVLTHWRHVVLRGGMRDATWALRPALADVSFLAALKYLLLVTTRCKRIIWHPRLPPTVLRQNTICLCQTCICHSNANLHLTI